MARLLGVSGSLRRLSYNAALLHAARELLPEGHTLEIATIEAIPLYNADLEAESGIPGSVETLKAAIAGADGVILATPEYNNGIPGVFKNAIDWASRPPGDVARVFGGKPVVLIGASPGGFGTILAQNAWLPVLRTLGMELWPGGRLMVQGAGKAFDAEGSLIDDAVRARLARLVADFIDVVNR